MSWRDSCNSIKTPGTDLAATANLDIAHAFRTYSNNIHDPLTVDIVGAVNSSEVSGVESNIDSTGEAEKSSCEKGERG
jgi:hypothetical protein